MRWSRRIRLGFAGFGNVNRALVRMLTDRRSELERRWGLTFEIVLLSSARRGAWVEPGGIDPACAATEGWSSSMSTLEAIAVAPIDLLFEGTTLDPVRGEPATSHVRTALERGVSVVSANKGPVAFAARDLLALAKRAGAGFRFESAVADCLPVFDLFEFAVPVGRVTSFEGVLNSTSNLVLQAVARGETVDAAVEEMKRRGLTEADPSFDLDGWDQAVKAVIVANVLMGRSLKPSDVERTPLSAVDPQWVRAEEGAGRTVRLAASGGETGTVRVAPVSLEPGRFLAALPGGSLGIALETELAGTLLSGIIEPGVDQVAYGMISDMIAIQCGRPIVPSPLISDGP